MSAYLDTSFLIAAVTPEAASEAALAWLDRHGADSLMISDWTLVETASALALKVRAGHLTPAQAHAVRSHVDTWATDSFETLAIGRDAFRGATRLLDRPGTQLRAGDALHLAIAQDEGATLVTFDAVLAAEAASAGVRVEVPTDPDG